MLVSVDTKDCLLDTNTPTFGSDVRARRWTLFYGLSATDGKYDYTPLGVGDVKQNKRKAPLKGCKGECGDTRNGWVSVDTLIRKRLWSL